MGHLMMDSKGWPYDSFDCLSFIKQESTLMNPQLQCLQSSGLKWIFQSRKRPSIGYIFEVTVVMMKGQNLAWWFRKAFKKTLNMQVCSYPGPALTHQGFFACSKPTCLVFGSPLTNFVFTPNVIFHTGWTAFLATPLIYLCARMEKKNRVLNWPLPQMTESRIFHPQKMTESRTCHP